MSLQHSENKVFTFSRLVIGKKCVKRSQTVRARLCQLYEIHSNSVEGLGPGNSTMTKPPESSKQKNNDSSDVLVFYEDTDTHDKSK